MLDETTVASTSQWKVWRKRFIVNPALGLPTNRAVLAVAPSVVLFISIYQVDDFIQGRLLQGGGFPWMALQRPIPPLLLVVRLFSELPLVGVLWQQWLRLVGIAFGV